LAPWYSTEGKAKSRQSSCSPHLGTEDPKERRHPFSPNNGQVSTLAIPFSLKSTWVSTDITESEVEVHSNGISLAIGGDHE
jgi:hypothetical protein